jgi:hypothetical protein
MKQYVIDQLRELDFYQIKDFLDRNTEGASLEGVYSVNLPAHLYTAIQSEHGKCHPFYFAISLTRNDVAFELLIRSRHILRCSCIAYATQQQRDYIIAFADRMLEDLRIKL